MADAATAPAPGGATPYSFRDPHSRVVVGDAVVRELDATGAAHVRAFLGTDAYARLVSRGLIVPPDAIEEVGAGHLRLAHPRIDEWSYPYEWAFTMLRDAALVHLEIQRVCAADGFTLSDATSFNITFVGGRPVFIDYGSFVPRSPDEPWWAYTDFCEHFLYPLMLTAYTGVELAPLLRGGLGRVSLADAHALLRSHKRRRGVLKHVLLPHLAASRTDLSVDDVSTRTSTKMTPELYLKIIDGLSALIASLELPGRRSTWSDYADRSHYSDADLSGKEAFVERIVTETGAARVLDIGANDGHFARLAARHAESVVAADADHVVVDDLYVSRPPANVLPLVVDATNPSPAMGWRSRERSELLARIRPDLVLALAVLHHISIARNVPLPQIAEWMVDTGADFVVEFVHRDDPKVAHLLSRKTDPGSFDYSLSTFRRSIAPWFDIGAQQALPSGTRTMLHLLRNATR